MEKQSAIERGICTHNSYSCGKLHVTDWMKDISGENQKPDIVEVRFKNTRKDYFRNVNKLKLCEGDIVAVEGSPGHDVGIVSLTGELVKNQMKKHRPTTVNGELRKIYRHARPGDISKWKEAISLEYETMIQSRKIAASLNLEMKIGDVEYQGDRSKATFYYIANGRIDFRQLIKVLADTFRIRVEMKQIGARQEAARIGGIGSCGRELCCSSWISNFVSVTTNAANCQDISMNPQKLAGQCGKLKCCINYEVHAYIDAQKDFPPNNVLLEAESGTYQFLKADVFKRIYWYSKRDNAPSALLPVSVDVVRKVQKMNRQGKKPERLVSDSIEISGGDKDTFLNTAGQEDINRFNEPGHKRRGKRRKPKSTRNYSKHNRKRKSQGK